MHPWVCRSRPVCDRAAARPRRRGHLEAAADSAADVRPGAAGGRNRGLIAAAGVAARPGCRGGLVQRSALLADGVALVERALVGQPRALPALLLQASFDRAPVQFPTWAGRCSTESRRLPPMARRRGAPD
ncbi:unnamed protein product [Prorocentrum cordatum]|uniref:Uncharacterized protein n=1 Tax=Prorocentrum cordatum TaxID=2364126 RepID=A0ABN9SQD1_9DINO|nr:unnamed protein product [Polarella glacialis]